MSNTIDVRGGDQAEITDIKWRSDEDYNLVKERDGEVSLPAAGAEEITNGSYLFDSEESARSLIRAIEKAIELEWVV